ncbi:hypothetical protein [Dethiosulfatarculus sandiegensis]|uniref:PsbP C-terminal domain-containing protein n=1 Tax=Dethiosulfatarculus sandiegensis TaxID=1429043 RepID=A0A0D2K3D1_9BACT|nr:hypothetical protein [Dethiosulfatarculus sandiegensis]KIX16055.1 hypothetical protein X474_00770 [Dethiosulfatarculus sandiegensis]
MLSKIGNQGLAGNSEVKLLLGLKFQFWVCLVFLLCFGLEAAAETKPDQGLISPDKEAVVLSRASSEPAPTKKVDYSFFKSSEMAFTCLMPENWQTRKMGNGDLLILPEASENGLKFSIKIRLQKIKGQGRPALKRKIEDSGKQFLRAPKGQILKENKTMIAGKEAPYLVAAYRALDKQGQTRVFAHALVAFLRQDRIMQIDYFAPYRVYQEKLPYFQGVLDSLRLLPLKP